MNVGDEAEDYLRTVTPKPERRWQTRTIAITILIVEAAWLVGFTYGAWRLAGWIGGAW